MWRGRRGGGAMPFAACVSFVAVAATANAAALLELGKRPRPVYYGIGIENAPWFRKRRSHPLTWES